MRKQLTIGLQVFFCILVAVVANIGQQPAATPKYLDGKVYEPYLGTYQDSSGELIVVGRNVRRLFVLEPRTGRARGLVPKSESSSAETTWSAGPSLMVYTPTTFQVIFVKNKAGDVTGLTVKEAGKKDRVAKKARFYTEEDVTYKNGDVTLGGKLLLPTIKGPHPAVILLHGSGFQDHNGERSEIRWVADHFARNGYAALIYDKRGFGMSGGNMSAGTFEDFAKDALAGLMLLKGRPDIDPKKIGFWGISQAGWVMLTATKLSKDIAFIISVSAGGSGYTVTQQNNYNIAAEMRTAGFSQDDIARTITSWNLFYEVVRAGERGDGSRLDATIKQAIQQNEKLKDWIPSSSTEIDWKKRDQWYLAFDIDLDPAPLWESYDGPVLGIFGELDSSTPVAQVVPIMGRALANRKNTDYAIKVFPHANHNIMFAESGSDSELPKLDRFLPEYFDTMTDWLRSRVKS